MPNLFAAGRILPEVDEALGHATPTYTACQLWPDLTIFDKIKFREVLSHANKFIQ